MPRSFGRMWVVLALVVLVGCAVEPAPPPRQPVLAAHRMVAAAHPLAAEAGLSMLRRGGSAADAAIAAQLVLTLVEPQSSGIGGGGFLLHYQASAAQAEDGGITAFDGRETAPAALREALLHGPDGRPQTLAEASASGMAVGTPGVLRMLDAVHRAHGRLPWRDLFAPAIELAEGGFPVSPRLHEAVANTPALKAQPASAAYFWPGGAPLRAGQILTNPQLATTFRILAEQGAEAFYQGAIAAEVAAAVQSAANPGVLAETDLKAYQPKPRDALCRPYRLWLVCGMPPPSSGGLAVLQILGILAHFDMAALPPERAEAVHVITQASRLAFADRDWLVGDPDFEPVPVVAMLDPLYLARRAASISWQDDMGTAEPGIPGWLLTAPAEELPSTSHISVIDGDGNAVSFTSSIEAPFGAKLMVRGFLLNNEMTDFSLRSSIEGGVPSPNAPLPGKRPRSSMAPILVFERAAGGKHGRLSMSLGSPGGPRIIDYVAKTVIAVLDWEMDMQAAIDLPNVVNLNGPTLLEENTKLEALKPELEQMGHHVVLIPLTSGVQGIRLRDSVLEGGADSRREGVAVGD